MVSAVPEDSENHTLFSGIYPFTQKKIVVMAPKEGHLLTKTN